MSLLFVLLWVPLGCCLPSVGYGQSRGNGSDIQEPDSKLTDSKPTNSNPDNKNAGNSQPSDPCVVQSNPRPGKPLILLGRFAQEPYVVAVPGRDRHRLASVRTCTPDALILPSRRGSYIHVASFADRTAATHLSQHLRRLGFDARVAYFE